MELESKVTVTSSSKTSLRVEYLKQCCKPTYQTKWLKNEGANLVLIWNFLAMSVFHYYSVSEQRDSINKTMQRPKGSELIAMGSLLLIGGWLADAYFGRYKVICCGMWIMWIGSLLSAFSLIISYVNATYSDKGDKVVSLLSKFVMGTGFGLFQANIIQFGIDQLSDASSTEITSFIVWYMLTLLTSGITMYYSAPCSPDYVGVLVLTVCLTLALCTYLLFNHLLLKEQIIQNPLTLIWKVVHYSIKNNHLQGRFSALKEYGILSKLDIAKKVYAGPFTNEQVEDVKTFFRVITILTSCTIAHSGLTTVNEAKDRLLQHLQNWPNTDTTLGGCYKVLSFTHISYTFTAVVILLYQIIIHPVFHNCIPKVSITTKFVITVVLFFVRIVFLLGIESASYYNQLGANVTNVAHCTFQNRDHHVMEIDFHWIIATEILNGLSVFLLIFTGMEFICAQAPFNMKGLVFGITYSLFGLGTLIQTAVSIPFLFKQPVAAWKKAPLTCEIWFFIIQAVIVLVGIVLMIITIKGYRKRIRSNLLRSDWQRTI